MQDGPQGEAAGHADPGFWSSFLAEARPFLHGSLIALIVYLAIGLGSWVLGAVGPRGIAAYAEWVDILLLGAIIPLHAVFLLLLFLRHVYHEVRRGGRSSVGVSPPPSQPPPVAAPPGLPEAVPEPAPCADAPEVVATFTGREECVAEVVALLGERRVVTLHGLGGIGKTEIAKAVAARAAVAAWATAGVCYVDLQSATSVEAVLAEMQARLGLPPVTDSLALAQALRSARLYVLDDLFLAYTARPDDIRALVRALHDHAAPAHFLMTSRDPIDLPGIEAARRVPPLPPEHAEQLFRAEAELCEYRWQDGDDAHLHELLGDLEGWPLAIALGARQLAVLSLGDLMAQWRRHHTDVLAVPGETGRNASVETSLRVSYDSLPASDMTAHGGPEGWARGLLRLFADLPAGASVETLGALCGDHGVRTAALLVGRGLLELADGRYTMLMPVRDFAGRQRRPDVSRLREPLDEALLHLAREWGAEEDRWIRRQGEAVRLLLAELPNLHAALDRAAGSADNGFVARLTDAIRRLYPYAVPGPEALRRLLAGAEAAEAAGEKVSQANCIKSLGDVHWMLDEYPEARGRYEEAVAVYRAIGSRLGEANCIKSLGDVHYVLDEYPEARGRYEEAVAAFRAIGDRLGEANCLDRLGDVHYRLAEYPEARGRYEEALAIYRAIGHRLGEANCIQGLGQVHRMLAEYPEAGARYEEAVAVYRAIGSRLGEANCLDSLGDVHYRLAEYPEARRRYEEAVAVYRATGSRLGEAGTIWGFARLARAEGRKEEAAEQYEQAAQLYEAIGLSVWSAEVRAEREALR